MIFQSGPCNEHLEKISCLYHQVKYFLKISHLAAPLLRIFVSSNGGSVL